MKRDHDTEPGPPPVEEPPSSQSRPRPITARGIGQPAPPPVERNNDTVPETDARQGVPRATMTSAPAPRPSHPVYENDSLDEAVKQIGERRHPFPVSLEPGWTEHAPLRFPPRSNDTLPMHGKLVVESPTDPGERQKREVRHEVTLPPVVLPTRRRSVLAVAFVGVALLIASMIVVLSNGGRPRSESNGAPSSTANAWAPVTSATASVERSSPSQPTAAPSAPLSLPHVPDEQPSATSSATPSKPPALRPRKPRVDVPPAPSANPIPSPTPTPDPASPRIEHRDHI